MKVQLDLEDNVYGQALWISQTEKRDLSEVITDLVRRGLEAAEAESTRFPLFGKNTNPDEIGNDTVRDALEEK